MIRHACKDDCLQLAALSIKVWLDTYAAEGIKREYAQYALATFTESYFSSLLDSPDYNLLVIEKDQVIQGYALLNMTSNFQSANNGFELEKLYIDTRFKGQGLGKQLLTAVEHEFGNVYWLYTWVENESNGFYQHLGFRKIGKLIFEFAGTQIENNVYQSGLI
ncbi:MAG: GNAT family N-acetyltransferase [Pseudomonadota bacterium]|nr:GNAT family N-acetyltransferase [Pseudomonadota bacterium]